MNNAYYYKSIFHGKCPYNNKACEDFECNGCKVQEEEIKYMEELDREEEKEYEEWHSMNGVMKMPKGLFDKIYNEAKEDNDDI